MNGSAKLIGVDVGTQGTKVALFSLDGVEIAQSFHKSRLLRTVGGQVEEDPEEQLKATCDGIRDCLDKSRTAPRDVVAISIDGQMAGVIGVGQDGRNVTPYDSWLDVRCSPYIEVMQSTAGAEILRRTGTAPSFNHGPKILWWKHERTETYARIRSFVVPSSYVAMRMCNLAADSAFVDYTHLHFTGFADNERLQWDDELCRAFRVDRSKLPLIVAPTTIVGTVGCEASAATGLIEGTPVAAGCGDTAASFLSCGAASPGLCADVAGTASVFAVTTAEFRPDEETGTLACARSAMPGLFHHYAYVNGGGMNIEWFRGLLEAYSGKTSDDKLFFDQLNDLAGAIPFETDDPYFVPHFGGRVVPSAPHLRGAWAGLGWSHTLGHLYRSMLEGVAFEYGGYLSTLRRLIPGINLAAIRSTGGGADSLLWNRIKAAVCGLPVTQVSSATGAALGSAIVAGLSVGVLESASSATQSWVQLGNETNVEPELVEHYSPRLKRYQELVQNLLEFAEI